MDRQYTILVFSKHSNACNQFFQHIKSLPFDIIRSTGMTLLSVDNADIRKKIEEINVSVVPTLLIKYFDKTQQQLDGEDVYTWVSAVANASGYSDASSYSNSSEYSNASGYPDASSYSNATHPVSENVVNERQQLPTIIETPEPKSADPSTLIQMASEQAQKKVAHQNPIVSAAENIKKIRDMEDAMLNKRPPLSQ